MGDQRTPWWSTGSAWCEPGDPIVLTATWASHRGDALDACRHIMEELKSRAPFWKREATASEARWVQKNTDGYLRGHADTSRKKMS